MIVRTEKSFDGAFWEASCPDGWIFNRDMTVRGYPYVFESQSGCRLQLGSSEMPKINYGAELTRPDIRSEALRTAYVMTLGQAQMNESSTCLRYVWATLRGMRRLDSKVRRHDLGKLSGFTYMKRGKLGWVGFFIAEPWMLYVDFSAPIVGYERESAEALEILGSVRFRR